MLPKRGYFSTKGILIEVPNQFFFEKYEGGGSSSATYPSSKTHIGDSIVAPVVWNFFHIV